MEGKRRLQGTFIYSGDLSDKKNVDADAKKHLHRLDAKQRPHWQ